MVKNTDYETLKGISCFLTVKEIAKYRKVSKTAIYRRIYKLLEKGLIRKIGRTYELTDLGINRLNSLIGLPQRLRLHNLAFKITIFNKPKGWDIKRNKIVQCRAYSKATELNNNQYEIHCFSNIKVKTTSNSIIFYMPSYYGRNTDECFKEALDNLWQVVPKIENLFKIILIKDRKCNIEIISQHYARLQDSLAKIYKEEDNKLYVKDEEGNIWLIADFSFKVSELETIYNKTAKEDMDTMQNFLNDLRKNPATITQVTEMIRSVTTNQMIFDKNMKSHLKILNRLGKAVDNLTTAVERRNVKDNWRDNQKTLNEY